MNIFKTFLDSKWAWDYVQGPIYNKLIAKVTDPIYDEISREIKPRDYERILDIGTGPGYIATRIALDNPNVGIIGVDYSFTQIRSAIRFKYDAGVKNCSFFPGNAMRLPFDNESFSYVISVASLKHWAKPDICFREIHRVLKREGTVLILEADKECDENELKRFMKVFSDWYVWDPFMRWYLKKIVFGKSYTPFEAEAIAIAAGFKEVVSSKIKCWPFFMVRMRKA
ncbi:class I SAM-dependent methyltransferase [bacterium]|nr:class I SAM-dependent methyltransferase [bacterium]